MSECYEPRGHRHAMGALPTISFNTRDGTKRRRVNWIGSQLRWHAECGLFDKKEVIDSDY